MKIALLLPGGVDPSGRWRVIPAFLWLIRRLSRRHELHVFALRQNAVPGCWTLEGAQVHDAGGSAWRLWRMLRAEHARGRFDVVQSMFAGNPGLAAVFTAWWFEVPVAVHLAGGELAALPDIGYGGRLRASGRLRERLVLHGADLLTAASEPMIRAARQLGRVARRVPLGVDRDEWPPVAPRPRVPGECLRLVCVASINRVKDHSLLLRSLALAADAGCPFELDLAGEDTLQGSLQRECAALGLAAHVRFHGFQPQARVRELMLGAHLNLVTSRHEAGPLVVLEAAHCGVPTLGTRVGHLAEWAPTAAVAVPHEARALSHALVALERDDTRRLALARAAQSQALSHDADVTANRLEANLLELVRRGSLRDAESEAIPPGDEPRDAGGAAGLQREHQSPPPVRAP